MKKAIIFYVGAPVGVAVITTAAVVPLAFKDVIADRHFDLERYEANKNFDAKEFTPSNPATIFDANQSADINLYFTSAGTATYTNMLRLAMLSAAADSEVHFAYSPVYEHQGKTDGKYFEKFLKTTNSKSSVINMHGNSDGQVTALWKRIIESNPNKKINIWWNSDHLDHWNGARENNILELAGYRNVNLQLIEDGSAIGYVANTFQNQDLVKKFSNPKSMEKIDYSTQYFAQNAFSNVYSWFSAANAFAPYLSKPEFKNLKIFDQKTLADQIFNTRITLNEEQAKMLIGPESKGGDIRMHTFYPHITGLDWKNTLIIFNKAKSDRPGKKSLILLGSYGVDGEDKYIKQVWEKYHNDFNIFYKGHPGHSEHSNYITNDLIPNEAHEGMYVLESSIASEELTRDHIADGLRFDNVVSVGATSAMDGFPNLDLTKDYLEQYNGTVDVNGTPQPIVNGQSGWDDVIQWLKTQGWVK